MASMRVNQLAKEFGMTGRELLDRLREMKIPAKSHASMLADSDVDKVRKELSAEEDARKKDGSSAKGGKSAQAAEEEAARRAAREKELADRAAARAARDGVQQPTETNVATTTASAPAPAKKTVKKAPVSDTGHARLASQIEAERARLEHEAEERTARARAEKMAAEVRKRRAVEETLRERGGRGSSKASDAQGGEAGGKGAASDAKSSAASAEKPKKDVATSRGSSDFNALLSQIESEQRRISGQSAQQDAKSAKPDAPTKDGDAQRTAKKRKGSKAASPESAGGDADSQGTSRKSSGAGSGGKAKRSKSKSKSASGSKASASEQSDRYAKMAVQAEKLQRDKVLAEARAAVAAASTREGEGRRKKRKEKREAEARERAEMEAVERGLDPELVLDDSVVQVPQGTTVAKLAELLNAQPNDIVKRLFMLGQTLTLTQTMSDDLIELVADDMGRKVRVVSPEEEYAVVYNDSEEDLVPRPPVVTVMGHVDHGKTSLLDAIRDTGVVESEAGGITQHIGASVVQVGDRQITFIDTPGHEAFTAMRARGAQVTDVIVLVVAADDGVMPQTVEAINHAKAADVPIVVAVNKIDKDGANPDRVRQELVEHEVIPEEWGGSNMFVDVSAKKKLHIDDLLETILLQADVLELKANPDAEASGFVIEANLDKGRGPVATVLVQRGTLHPGDALVAGSSYGHVRALINPHGEHVSEARPADPVEVLGLGSVPVAGDEFRVFADERDARKLAEERALRERLVAQDTRSHMSLEDLFSRIEEGKQTDLNLILKADVQGSIEAMRDAFEKMDQSEVRINIVHSAVGGITETDVTLAAASDAIIIGFNVRPMGKSREQAEKEKVDIRLYRVIYQVIEDINAARVGLLSPEIVEEDTGVAEVRELFKLPKVGVVAGCYVTEGEVSRNDKVRVVREGTVVFEGELASLRRFKDDVKSVKQGYECGIGISGYQDVKVGDLIEGYQVKEQERTE